MKTGISVYLSSSREDIERVFERGVRAGASYVFTSFLLPDCDYAAYGEKARWLLERVAQTDVSLVADIGPESCQILGVERLEELASKGLSYVRLDYGFSPEDVVRLSETFHIVFNASTVARDEILSWQRAGADFSRFAACHNFYPKPLTGLSVEEVTRVNTRLAGFGFETMAFIPGDGELRGALFEGLPTLECQRVRRADVALNMLELSQGCGSDVVLVGDPDLSDEGWASFAEVSDGYVIVRCELDPAYSYLRGQIHHDRFDPSALVFRSMESRTTLKPEHVTADAGAGKARPVGTIAVSNDGYGRYQGEVEISRADVAGDSRMNVVGHVADEDVRLLPYITHGFGLKFV